MKHSIRTRTLSKLQAMLVAIFMLVSGLAFGQSEPSYYPLNSSDLVWPNTWASTAANGGPFATPYVSFWQTNTSNAPSLTDAYTGNYTLTFTATSSSRITQASPATTTVPGGFLIQTTGTAVSTPPGYPVQVTIGLNTSSISGSTPLKFNFNIGQPCITSTSRVFGITVLYRIGSTGSFTALPNYTIQQGDAACGLSAANTLVNNSSWNITLPASLNGNAKVQLAFRYYSVSGGGTRPPFQISNISVCSSISPTVLPTTLLLGNTSNTINGSFTAATSVPTGGYLVTRRTAGTGGAPVSGNAYIVGSTLGSAGNTSIVVALGSGTSFTDPSLTSGVSYNYDIYSVNSSGSCSQYSATALTNGYTLPCTANACPLGAFSITQSCINTQMVNITAPSTNFTSGHSILVFAKSGAVAITQGASTTNPAGFTSNSLFTASSTPWTGDAASKCVFNGSGFTAGQNINFSVSGLTANTNYQYLAYVVAGSGGAGNYSTPSTGTSATLASIPAVNGVSLSSSSTSQNLSWTLPVCYDEVIVVARKNYQVSGTPTGDGTAYTAVANYTGGGTTFNAITGQKVVYRGTGTGVTITGLVAGGLYNYSIFTRKGTVWSIAASAQGTTSGFYIPSAATIPYTQNFAAYNDASLNGLPDEFATYNIVGSLSSSYPTASFASSIGLTPSVLNSLNSAYVGNMGTGLITMLNTTSSLTSFAMAINTLGKSNLYVQYDASTQSYPANAQQQLGLQYRVGTTGNFIDVPGTSYTSPLSGTTNLTGTAIVAGSTSTIGAYLPSGANNQSYVQLRWVIRDITSAGSRAGFAIDNINISVQGATNYYIKQGVSNIDITQLSSWGDQPYGVGAAPSSFTANFQTFILDNNVVNTVNSNFTISGNGSGLVVGNGASGTGLTFPSGKTFSGNLSVRYSSAIYLAGTFVPTFNSIENGSYVIFNGSTGTQAIPNGGFFNLILTGASTKLINSSLAIGGSLRFEAGNYVGAGSPLISVGGDVEVIGSPTFDTIFNRNVSIEFNGTGNQYFNTNGYNFKFRNLNTVTTNKATGNFSLSPGTVLTLTGSAWVRMSGTNQFKDNGNVITLANSLFLTGSASNFNITGKFIFGTSLAGTSTVADVNGFAISAQLNNIDLNSAGGNVSFTGSAATITVKGTITALGSQAGGTLNLGSNTLNLGGSLIDNTTYVGGAVSATGGTLSFTGAGTTSSWVVGGDVTGATMGNVVVAIGKTLNVSGKLLTFGNNTFTNNGTVVATNNWVSGTNTLNFLGTGATTIKQLTASANITNGSSHTVNISDNLTIPTAKVYTNNGFTRLLSNSSLTARLVTTGSANYTGNITMQRWLPSISNLPTGCNYMVSNPTGSNLTLQNYQNAGVPMSGFPGASTTTGNPSVLFYSPNVSTYAGWFVPTSITNVVKPGFGSMIFFRTNPFYTFNNQTYEVTGSANIADFTYPAASFEVNGANNYNMIGNPFASTIDFSDATNFVGSEIGNTYYIWSHQSRNYVTYTRANGGNPALSNGSNGYLSSSQSFFVTAATSAATLTIKNTARVANTVSTLRQASSNANAWMEILATSPVNTDKAYVIFNNGNHRAAVDGSDASKLEGTDLAISSLPVAGAVLLSNAMPALTSTLDTLALRVVSTSIGTHSLTFSSLPVNSVMYLKDRMLGTTTLITEGMVHSFVITAAPASQGNGRFVITYGTSAVTGLTATAPKVSFNVYPNPSTNGSVTFNIAGLSNTTDVVAIKVIDAIGKVVYTSAVSVNGMVSASKTASINVPAGIYTVSATSPLNTFTTKLVVQ